MSVWLTTSYLDKPQGSSVPGPVHVFLLLVLYSFHFSIGYGHVIEDHMLDNYLLSKKSSAQVGFRVNSVSFCNNLMHSISKSKVPLRNCEHLKPLGVTLQKS